MPTLSAHGDSTGAEETSDGISSGSDNVLGDSTGAEETVSSGSDDTISVCGDSTLPPGVKEAAFSSPNCVSITDIQQLRFCCSLVSESPEPSRQQLYLDIDPKPPSQLFA